jgi:putative Holliday junction resolvase
MRILGIDPGEKNVGIAISDPSGNIANPLTVIQHSSRPIDAALIAQIARDNSAEMIIVGQSLDTDGKPTLSGRRARRLAAAIRTQTHITVRLWDESHSTQIALNAQRKLGRGRTNQRGHMDEIAATVILQSYLDTLHPI